MSFRRIPLSDLERKLPNVSLDDIIDGVNGKCEVAHIDLFMLSQNNDYWVIDLGGGIYANLPRAQSYEIVQEIIASMDEKRATIMVYRKGKHVFISTVVELDSTIYDDEGYQEMGVY